MAVSGPASAFSIVCLNIPLILTETLILRVRVSLPPLLHPPPLNLCELVADSSRKGKVSSSEMDRGFGKPRFSVALSLLQGR